jgi:hypothetical protein
MKENKILGGKGSESGCLVTGSSPFLLEDGNFQFLHNTLYPEYQTRDKERLEILSII